MSNENPINHDLPSPETLAGIYICMEGEEEIFVSSKPTAEKVAANYEQIYRTEAEKLAGITVTIDDASDENKKDPPEKKD